MFAKIRGRLGVAILGAVIAVILNLTLLACSGMVSTGSAAGAAGSTPTIGAGYELRDQVYVTVSVPPHQSATAIAYCPDGMVVTGGGFSASDLEITDSGTLGRWWQAWQVRAFNPLDQARDLRVEAVCVKLGQ